MHGAPQLAELRVGLVRRPRLVAVAKPFDSRTRRPRVWLSREDYAATAARARGARREWSGAPRNNPLEASLSAARRAKMCTVGSAARPEHPTSDRPPLVGLDLEDVDDLRERFRRQPALCRRLFTPAERAYAASRSDPTLHLAGRLCAKEAVVKALCLGSVDPHDIEVVDGRAGLRLVLHGDALNTAARLAVDVRITLAYRSPLAAAVAIALTQPQTHPE